MAYSTLPNVRLALTPDGSTDDRSTAAGMSDEALGAAIADADAEIDVHLAGIYETPVASVDGLTPEPIRSWSTSLATWYATLTFMKGKDIAEADPIRLRRNRVVELLSMVRTGRLTLDLPRTPEGPTDLVGGATNLWGGALFDHTDWLPGNVGYPSGPGPYIGPEYSRGGPR